MHVLRDPIWQFIGAILTLSSIALALATFYSSRKVRRLSYDVLGQYPVATVNTRVTDMITVLYNGQPVDQVQLAAIRIINDGNDAILASDYLQPITVSIGDGSNILDASVNNWYPDNIAVDLRLEDNRSIVPPTLFNPGDYFSISILYAGARSSISIEARIVNALSIERRSQRGLSVVNLPRLIKDFLVMFPFTSIFIVSTVSHFPERPFLAYIALGIMIANYLLSVMEFWIPRLVPRLALLHAFSIGIAGGFFMMSVLRFTAQ